MLSKITFFGTVPFYFAASSYDDVELLPMSKQTFSISSRRRLDGSFKLSHNQYFIYLASFYERMMKTCNDIQKVDK